MTGLAVRHPVVGRNALGSVMALHAIHHHRQSQIRQAGASGDGVVASGAIEVEPLLRREMRDVRKLDVDIFTGNRCLSDQAAILSKARVFNFLGRVAADAACRVQRGR